jgi:DNA-binding transcriptional MerR regulator
MSAESSELLFDIADEKLLTIGTVVERLRAEFPDVSVSKLRYLEEQHLIAPQRTKSGYRLFSQDDYRRLVRVLAMQRDEYLPLKVIRRELERNAGTVTAASRQGLRKADLLPSDDERQFTAEEVQNLTGADASLLSELEEYELVKGRQLSGVRRYSEIDAGIIGAAQQLAQAGLRPKNLRIVKSAVDREVGLVEGVLLPALRANRPERRRAALDEVEHILQATTQLRQLLLAKNIRRLTAGHSVD